jgi:hypothetical protein
MPAPSVFGIVAFAFQRHAFAGSNPAKTDYQYWRDKGWLAPDAQYYYATPMGPAKAGLSWALRLRPAAPVES